MKKLILVSAILIGLISSINGQNIEESKNSYGILFMAGGRYDNYRMCVASDAGVEGGMMADIMFSVKHKVNRVHNLTVNIPIMRPVLFGLAFNMLQFEPEITFEYHKAINDRISIASGIGLGISLHYGPDYLSDLDNLSDPFFAMGPIFSYQSGIQLKKDSVVKSVIGIKAFYSPLYAKDMPGGTVLGGALVYYYYF